MARDPDVRLHKSMAMGEGYPEAGDNFGVTPMPAPMMSPNKAEVGAPLADASRGSPGTFGGGRGVMASSAAPDHGPHHHRRGR